MPATHRTVLILGGTREATELASLLSTRDDLTVITSLAGRTRNPETVSGERRIGGFGGAKGLARFLVEEVVSVLVDATHPFATGISENGRIAAEETGTQRLVLRRPPWIPREIDSWRMVPSLEAACGALPKGGRAFLALGSQYISVFAGRDDVELILRMVDPPKDLLPLSNARLVIGKPGTADQEEELLQSQAIDVLVCRNSGGQASFAKLEAAANLSLPVIMIERPNEPDEPHFETIEALAAAIG